jgi:putative transposase
MGLPIGVLDYPNGAMFFMSPWHDHGFTDRGFGLPNGAMFFLSPWHGHGFTDRGFGLPQRGYRFVGIGEQIMPHSLSQVLVHLVFSTKNRAPMLEPKLRANLHLYLAATLREHDCPPLQVGGVEDHVHLLFALSRTLAISKVVEIVKTKSSRWIKTQGPLLSGFYWQGGYGAFSVNASSTDSVVAYIRNQEKHHQSATFQDEYRDILADYKMTYDERYVWD